MAIVKRLASRGRGGKSPRNIKESSPTDSSSSSQNPFETPPKTSMKNQPEDTAIDASDFFATAHAEIKKSKSPSKNLGQSSRTFQSAEEAFKGDSSEDSGEKKQGEAEDNVTSDEKTESDDVQIIEDDSDDVPLSRKRKKPDQSMDERSQRRSNRRRGMPQTDAQKAVLTKKETVQKAIDPPAPTTTGRQKHMAHKKVVPKKMAIKPEEMRAMADEEEGPALEKRAGKQHVILEAERRIPQIPFQTSIIRLRP